MESINPILLDSLTLEQKLRYYSEISPILSKTINLDQFEGDYNKRVYYTLSDLETINQVITSMVMLLYNESCTAKNLLKTSLATPFTQELTNE